jgi:hypothetical protein
MPRTHQFIAVLFSIMTTTHAIAGSWFHQSSLDMPGSKSFIQGAKGAYTIYYDEDTWQVDNDKSAHKEKICFKLDHKKGDAYAIATYEHRAMPLGSLKELTLSQFIDTNPPGRVVDEGIITVDGEKVLMLKMVGFSEDKPVTYYGYYVAGEWGTLEFVTYTGSYNFGVFEKDFSKLLNGLHINKPAQLSVSKL